MGEKGSTDIHTIVEEEQTKESNSQGGPISARRGGNNFFFALAKLAFPCFATKGRRKKKGLECRGGRRLSNMQKEMSPFSPLEKALRQTNGRSCNRRERNPISPGPNPIFPSTQTRGICEKICFLCISLEKKERAKCVCSRFKEIFGRYKRICMGKGNRDGGFLFCFDKLRSFPKGRKSTKGTQWPLISAFVPFFAEQWSRPLYYYYFLMANLGFFSCKTVWKT